MSDEQSSSEQQSPSEQELAALLVEALNLEGMEAASIRPTAPLFGHDTAGLGLDSIDALEIALAIQQKYGVELRSDGEEVRQIFGSLRALCGYVNARRSG